MLQEMYSLVHVSSDSKINDSISHGVAVAMALVYHLEEIDTKVFEEMGLLR